MCASALELGEAHELLDVLESSSSHSDPYELVRMADKKLGNGLSLWCDPTPWATPGGSQNSSVTSLIRLSRCSFRCAFSCALNLAALYREAYRSGSAIAERCE